MQTRTRTAFTISELLVVMAVVGTLIALLLPAVQMAREASRRSECQGKFKQLALALQHYHDTYTSFPSGVESRSAWTFHAAVLQFLDNGNLAKQRKREVASIRPPADCFTVSDSITMTKQRTVTGINSTASGKAPFLECPSDPRRGEICPHAVSGYGPFATHNYFGSMGGLPYRPPQPPVPGGRGKRLPVPPPVPRPFGPLSVNNGVLFVDSGVKLADVRDGTAHTIFLGERPNVGNLSLSWWACGRANDPASGNSGLGNGNPLIIMLQRPFKKGISKNGDSLFDSDAFHYWSYHPGVSGFAFVDGSVRFLNYGIHPDVLTRLATRKGREATPDLDN